MGDLTKTAKTLPSTILISFRQVRHNADNDNGKSSYDVEGKGKEVLADIISQQEQRAFLQENDAKRVEESTERLFLEKKQVQIHLREKFRNSPRVEGIAEGTAVEN